MSSRQHLGHKAIDILNYFEIKNVFKKDLQEIENSVFPKEAASKIVTQKADQRKNYQKLTSEL